MEKHQTVAKSIDPPDRIVNKRLLNHLNLRNGVSTQVYEATARAKISKLGSVLSTSEHR